MVIKSTSDALSYLYSFSLNQSGFRFRGQADYNWSLRPLIYRYDNFKRYQTIPYEKIILDSKPQKAIPPLIHTNYALEWLMICQHYGIPTRLLDWTNDILIALFFACFGNKEITNNGALFIINHNDYPLYYKYDESLMDSQELAFVNTNVVNPRMRSQIGCFLMWGHSSQNDKVTETYDLEDYHNSIKKDFFFEKTRIPSYFKKQILSELERIYSISFDNIFLKNGFLEHTYNSEFEKLKNRARLMTLYMTDADCLSKEEEKEARKMFKIDCRNMIGNCISLRKM